MRDGWPGPGQVRLQEPRQVLKILTCTRIVLRRLNLVATYHAHEEAGVAPMETAGDHSGDRDRVVTTGVAP